MVLDIGPPGAQYLRTLTLLYVSLKSIHTIGISDSYLYIAVTRRTLQHPTEDLIRHLFEIGLEFLTLEKIPLSLAINLILWW